MNIVIEESANKSTRCERKVTYADILAKNKNINNDKNKKESSIRKHTNTLIN